MARDVPEHHGPDHWLGQLSDLSNQQLVSRLNQEVGIRAWGSARSAFLTALKEELCKRDFDVSAVTDGTGLSLSHKVELVDGKLKRIAGDEPTEGGTR